MPALRQIEVYSFDELSERAKERARNNYRANCLDYEWWDSSLDWFKEIGAALGIEINDIYFRGFYSQGDGCAFRGTYSYAKGSVKAVREVCTDETIDRIASDLYKAQKASFYNIWAHCSNSGRYCNQVVECDASDRYSLPCVEESASAIQDCLKDFANWMYSQLEAEYEDLTSDEQVDESIVVNEYEYDANGDFI